METILVGFFPYDPYKPSILGYPNDYMETSTYLHLSKWCLRELFPELRKGLLGEAHAGADHLWIVEQMDGKMGKIRKEWSEPWEE